MISNGFGGDAAAGPGRVWTFADCEFDDSRLELRVHGTPVDLELKPLEVLQQLLLHTGETVSKEQLLNSVWPGLMVVDGSLATAVSKLRRALGDSQSTIVMTIPRVGYRLAVPVSARSVATRPPGAALDFEPGDHIPGREQWRLVRPLALPESRGVWLAENRRTRERRVFKFASFGARLKNLKREVTVSRFLRETLGPRPDFVRLLEWNFEAEPCSVESEYGGPNLVEWAEGCGGLQAIPIETRVQLIAEVAKAVAVAHEAGVVHKDLKPTNILVSEPAGGGLQVKVVDFGSASLVDPERLGALGITNLGLTQTGSADSPALAGTLIYLAPEVLSGKPSTAAADIFALGMMLYQVVVGDFRKPLSPGWESEIDDPVLRDDVARAACGDPSRRLASAAELADGLARLDGRRTQQRALESKQRLDEIARRKAADARARRPWMILAAAAVVAAVAVSLGFYRTSSSTRVRPTTVAILPFHNSAGDPAIGFLSFALPDEIATTLSHMRPLAIRPLSATSRYGGDAVNLQEAGRDLGASSIVTGRYLRVGDQLQVSMEAIDVGSNRLLWRDTVNVPADNMLMMQAQIAAAAQGRLAPVLGASVLVRNAAAPPKSEEAYALYLRSLALSYDPDPNKEALALLERSVALDSTYAPAWGAVSGRSYAASRFAAGGPAMLDRSDAAAERALALDPDYVEAASELILHRAERGDLVNAYRQANDLVHRRPDSAQAHHLLSYVLRYAGLVTEAGRECDVAVLLDREVLWGSCSSTFMEAGRYARAMDFIRKDYSSEWSKAHAIEIFVRDGRAQKAVQIGAPRIPEWDSYKMLLACIQHKPAAEIRALAAGVQVSDDPEVNYFFAGHLAYCGQTAAALDMLRRTVKGHYCSYPALDTDPMFSSLRSRPEFAEIRTQAIVCQNTFLEPIRQQFH